MDGAWMAHFLQSQRLIQGRYPVMRNPSLDSNGFASNESPRNDSVPERGRASRAALILAAACTCTATASFIPRDDGGYLPLAFLVVVLSAALLRRSTVPDSRRRAA
jgi:hypothetical protein